MKPASLSASSACHDRTRRRSFIHTIHSLKSDKRTPTKCPISPASVCEGSSSTQIPPIPTSIQHAKSCINLPLSSTPTPLLTLLLSTTSFLNATISEADQVQRLYTIDSKGPRTDIRRDDTVQGATVVGTIRWRPENDDERIPFGLKSNVTIGMAHGRKRFVEDFLKSNPLRNKRKFDIPHFPHSFVWRRSTDTYILTTSKSKRILASLEPAVLSAPPRIKIYEMPYERDETRPQLEYRGIAIVLLDYLVATALLLVTDKDEWQHVGRSSSSVSISSSDNTIDRWRLEVREDSISFDPFTDFRSRPSSPSPSNTDNATVVPSSAFSESGRTEISIAPSDTGPPASPSCSSQRTEDGPSPISESSTLAKTNHSSEKPKTPVHPFAYGYTAEEGVECPVGSLIDDKEELDLTTALLSTNLKSSLGPMFCEKSDIILDGYHRPRSASCSRASPETRGEASAPHRTARPATSSGSSQALPPSTPTEASGRRVRPLPTPPTRQGQRRSTQSTRKGQMDIPSAHVMPRGPPIAISEARRPSVPSILPTMVATSSRSGSLRGGLRRSASEATLVPGRSTSPEPPVPPYPNSLSSKLSMYSPYRSSSSAQPQFTAHRSSTAPASQFFDAQERRPVVRPLRIQNVPETHHASRSSVASSTTFYLPPPCSPPANGSGNTSFHGMPPPAYDTIDFSRP